MTKTQKEKMIFLNDKNLLSWMTADGLKPGLEYFQGSTTLKQYFGGDFLRGGTGPYIISASAAIYLADIARKREKEEDFTGEKFKPEEEILFVGGLQIYKEGITSTKQIKGADLVLNEKIWCAQKMDSTQAKGGGLTSLIFGNEVTNEGKAQRIESIIRGYQHLRKEEEEREKFQESISGSYRRHR